MIAITAQNMYFRGASTSKKPAKKASRESRDMLELTKNLAAHRVDTAERKEVKRQKTILDFARKYKGR